MMSETGQNATFLSSLDDGYLFSPVDEDGSYLRRPYDHVSHYIPDNPDGGSTVGLDRVIAPI